MKFLSYVDEGDYVRVVTDNLGRPDFVYEKKRFSSVDALNSEVLRSVEREQKMFSEKEVAFVSLQAELAVAGVVDATPEPVVEVVLAPN